MSQRTRKGSATAQRVTNTVATSAARSAPSSASGGDTQPRPHSAPPEDRICRIESAMRSFFQAQQTREERQEREAQLQNQRWRSLEHQFQQLQTLHTPAGRKVTFIQPSLGYSKALSPSGAVQMESTEDDPIRGR
ncbi:unnamed protein product [Boreogadus saida]